MTKVNEINKIIEDLEKTKKELEDFKSKRVEANESLIKKLEDLKSKADVIVGETQEFLIQFEKWRKENNIKENSYTKKVNNKPIPNNSNKEKKKPNIIKVAFFGTPQIAVSALESLFKSNKIKVEVVVTNSDQVIGRNQSEKQPSEVAQYASKNNLPLIKTSSINKEVSLLKKYSFDYLVTCAFGQILSKEVLSTSKKKAINVHASLLPKGRGGAPIHWSIIKGETETGISMMEMIEELDAGEVYMQNKVRIENADTYDSLYRKLSELIKQKTAPNLVEINNGLKGIKQNKKLVTFWPNIVPHDCKIDWNKTNEEIYNHVRGLYSKPMAHSILDGEKIKITKTKLFDEILAIPMKVYQPGEIVLVQREGILVATAESYIWVRKVIIPGKKEQDINELLNGKHPFSFGKIFN